MKIEKLIKIFEQCIPVYQKAVDEKWNYKKLEDAHLDSGICWFCSKRLNLSIENVFDNYYKNYATYCSYIFMPALLSTYNHINGCIKPRLEFLKQQVKELKKLKKQGYTHV